MSVCESSVKNISEEVGSKLYTDDGIQSERLFIPELHDEKNLGNRAYLQIDGAMIHHLKE